LDKTVDRLEEFLRSDLGLEGPVPLHSPSLAGREWDYVKECLDSGWVSTAGSYVERFESALAERCATRFAVATVNGTAALHVALVGLGVGPGDAVLCPALTFAATANAIVQSGAEPLFMDAAWAGLGMDAAKLGRFLDTDCEARDGALHHQASGRRIGAAVPVHVFGHPADMEPLVAVCDAHQVPVLEDATEALGSLYRGRPCGGIGRLGAISFNGNKIVTCGGGGMLVTDDAALARHLKHLTTTARLPHPWEYVHDEVGYNYRLPNVNAAIGCAQLEQLDGFLARKRRLFEAYRAVFAGSRATLLEAEPWAQTNHWLLAVVLADAAARDAFLEATHARDIQTRPAWRLLPELKPFRAFERADALETARDIAARTVTIPSSPWMIAHDATEDAA
jgi:perosamine synthetase